MRIAAHIFVVLTIIFYLLNRFDDKPTFLIDARFTAVLAIFFYLDAMIGAIKQMNNDLVEHRLGIKGTGTTDGFKAELKRQQEEIKKAAQP
jgi:hypothetical protein